MTGSTGHPDSAANLSTAVSRNPTAAPVVGVRDVVLEVTDALVLQDEFERHPPAGDPPSRLAEDLAIVQFNSDEADLVMDACTPRGHFFRRARQFGCRYAYVLDIDLADYQADPFLWDPDERLSAAYILSRVIVDNAISTEYAARIVDHADGEKQVIPRSFEDGNVHRLRNHLRDWLDAAEAAELAKLLERYWANKGSFPERVASLMWLGEYSRQTRWIDQIIPLTVSALEVLINTDRRDLVRQFTTRIPAIAAELGVPGISRSLCRQAYTDRSHGVHAGRLPFTESDAQSEPALVRLEKLRILHRALERRLIEDDVFRARFEDEETIRQEWPVEVRRGWFRRRERI